jgi:Flp pilus assembly protein TadD
MTDVLALFRGAQQGLAAQDPRHAVSMLELALEELPGDLGLLRLYARALYEFASLGRAEEVARAVLERAPADAETMVLLAATLRRTGRKDEAAVWQRLADLLDPSPEAQRATA